MFVLKHDIEVLDVSNFNEKEDYLISQVMELRSIAEER
jgi:hypothetical protein